MKRKYWLMLCCCIGLLFFYRGLFGPEQAKQKQTALVCAEGNAYPKELAGIRLSVASPQDMASGQTTPRYTIPVVFEDASLSVTDRQRIVSDLTILLSFASSFEKLKGIEIEPGVFRPETLFLDERESFFILDDGDQKSVRVGKVFSDEYLQLLALMDNHSEAIQKVRELVALLNGDNLLSKPIQVLRDLYHWEHSSDTPSDDEVRAVVAEMQQWKYLGVSALAFDITKPTRSGEVEVPVIFVLMVDKNEKDPSEFGGYFLEYKDGRWQHKWMP